MLELFYKNKNVEKYCLDIRCTQKDFGIQIAKKLSQRLSEAKSFNSVFDLLNSGIDNPHLLIGDLDGCMAWDLTAQVRLIIRISNSFNENTSEEIKTMTSVVVEGVRDRYVSS